MKNSFHRLENCLRQKIHHSKKMKPWFGLVRVSVLSLSHCARESPGWVLSYHHVTLCSAYCQSPDSYEKKWNSLAGHNPSQNTLHYKHCHNLKYHHSYVFLFEVSLLAEIAVHFKSGKQWQKVENVKKTEFLLMCKARYMVKSKLEIERHKYLQLNKTRNIFLNEWANREKT